MITPGFFFLVTSWIVLSVWNYGRVACNWDEFSHWVDIVKAVTFINDFGTNPAANSTFQSYPPAMMLFQYSLQKLNMLLNPGSGFSEWRTYFGFQIFILSVMLPFFDGLTFRQPVKLMLYGVIYFLAPLLFFGNYYNAVYIDPAVGIFFGAGMAMCILRQRRDGVYTAYICLLCAMLTLSKDVGFGLALVLALAYGVDTLLAGGASGFQKRFYVAPAALAAACLPKFLWSWELRSSGARVSFSGKIEWPVLMDVILGRDTSYRSGLVRTYWDALHTKTVALGNIPLKLNYITLLLVFLCVLFLLWKLHKIRQPSEGKRCGVIIALCAGLLIAYLAGMCVIYMFKFSEYEATHLASMERYLNIAFLGNWLVILLLLARWTCDWCRRWEAKAALLLMLLVVLPVRPFLNFTGGLYIKQSLQVRQPYEQLSGIIAEKCDGDDRIYFVSQETTGFDYWVSRFNARPNSFNGNFTWSIGEAFYEGDIWTKKTAPEEWQKLLTEQYDYVALYKVNDYFLTHFAGLFAEPEAIEVNALYRVNLQTGLLEKCK